MKRLVGIASRVPMVVLADHPVRILNAATQAYLAITQVILCKGPDHALVATAAGRQIAFEEAKGRALWALPFIDPMWIAVFFYPKPVLAAEA